MLRQAFLFLSRRRRLRRWFETSAAARRLTSRFIAGLTLADVLRVCSKLRGEGILATLDHLGENITTAEESEIARQFYLDALDAISKDGMNTTVSVKLTQLGLDLDDQLCRRNLEVLAAKALSIGTRIEIDMESSQYVDRTLLIAEAMHREFGCVRAVLQAYLHRTAEDARYLSRQGIPVRLCKGAYNEPPSIAFPSKRQVDENYVKVARMLIDSGVHPAIATHDPRIIHALLEYIKGRRIAAKDFEFQMLYGIRRDLQRRLVRGGWQLRLYVPYGDAWYPYFMRRLAERPANVFFIARNILRA